MEKYNFKGKTTEQLIEDLSTLRVSPDSHVADAISAQIQSHLVSHLNNVIHQATGGLIRQGINFEQSIEGARNNFVAESQALRESMGLIRFSLETFRESNERASGALTRATYVLAGVALIQAIIFVLQWLK